jgi:hypothetical protein
MEKEGRKKRWKRRGRSKRSLRKRGWDRGDREGRKKKRW